MTEASNCWTRISERGWSMVKRSANRRSWTRLATLHQTFQRKSPVSPSWGQPTLFCPEHERADYS